MYWRPRAIVCLSGIELPADHALNLPADHAGHHRVMMTTYMRVYTLVVQRWCILDWCKADMFFGCACLGYQGRASHAWSATASPSEILQVLKQVSDVF